MAFAVETLNTADPREQQAAAQYIDPALWPKEDKGKTQLWMVILIGMFLLGLAALACAVWLYLKDKDGTAIIAITSAVVAGVFGLFANPPASAGGGSGNG